MKVVVQSWACWEGTDAISRICFTNVYGVRGPCALTPDEASAATVGEAPSVTTSVTAIVGAIVSTSTGAGVGEGVGSVSPQIVSSSTVVLLPDLALPLPEPPLDDLALPLPVYCASGSGSGPSPDPLLPDLALPLPEPPLDALPQ
jgi:hypothetical protein